MTKVRGRFVWSTNVPLLVAGPIIVVLCALRGGVPAGIAGAITWAVVIGILSIVFARHTVTLDDTRHRLIIHPAKQLNPSFDEEPIDGLLVGSKTGVFDPAGLEYRMHVVHRNLSGYGFSYDELWTNDGTQVVATLSYNGWPAARRATIRQWVEEAGGTVTDAVRDR